MTYRPGQMQLSRTARSVLTIVAAVAGAIVATVPNETVRIVAAVVLTASTSLGIVPPHLETR